MYRAHPSVEDVRFPANTKDVNKVWDIAVSMFGLEDYCFVKSIEERYSILRKSAKPLEASNTTAPPNCLVVDVTGDGACFFYSFLSLLLGWVVPRDHAVVGIFKKNFTELVLKHRKKIITEKTVEPMLQSEKLKQPHLISFSHEAYPNCCPEDGQNEAICHSQFGQLFNTDEGWLKFTSLEEWCDIVLKPHTWANDEIITLVACLTGLSILTHNYKCGGGAAYFSYLPKPKYGLPEPILGGEVLLQWVNGNHYQVLVPMNQLDETVQPYKQFPKQLPQQIETIDVEKVSEESNPKCDRLIAFLKNSKSNRIATDSEPHSVPSDGDVPTVSENDIPSVSVRYGWRCEVDGCGKTLLTEKPMKTHMQKKHPNLGNVPAYSKVEIDPKLYASAKKRKAPSKKAQPKSNREDSLRVNKPQKDKENKASSPYDFRSLSNIFSEPGLSEELHLYSPKKEKSIPFQRLTSNIQTSSHSTTAKSKPISTHSNPSPLKFNPPLACDEVADKIPHSGSVGLVKSTPRHKKFIPPIARTPVNSKKLSQPLGSSGDTIGAKVVDISEESEILCGEDIFQGQEEEAARRKRWEWVKRHQPLPRCADLLQGCQQSFPPGENHPQGQRHHQPVTQSEYNPQGRHLESVSKHQPGLQSETISHLGGTGEDGINLDKSNTVTEYHSSHSCLVNTFSSNDFISKIVDSIIPPFNPTKSTSSASYEIQDLLKPIPSLPISMDNINSNEFHSFNAAGDHLLDLKNFSSLFDDIETSNDDLISFERDDVDVFDFSSEMSNSNSVETPVNSLKRKPTSGKDQTQDETSEEMVQPSKRKKSVPSLTKIPRGKCKEWKSCPQCSIEKDCGICLHCIHKEQFHQKCMRRQCPMANKKLRAKAAKQSNKSSAVSARRVAASVSGGTEVSVEGSQVSPPTKNLPFPVESPQFPHPSENLHVPFENPKYLPPTKSFLVPTSSESLHVPTSSESLHIPISSASHYVPTSSQSLYVPASSARFPVHSSSQSLNVSSSSHSSRYSLPASIDPLTETNSVDHDITTTNNLDSSIPAKTPKLYKCESCGKEFSRLSYAKSHCISTFSWQCDICEETIKQKNNVGRHKERCEKKQLKLAQSNVVNANNPINCEICAKQYSNAASLNTHMNSAHKDQQVINFKCDYDNCDVTVNTKKELTKHIGVNHENKTIIYCNMCDYDCLSKSGLRKHKQKFHKQESDNAQKSTNVNSASNDLETEANCSQMPSGHINNTQSNNDVNVQKSKVSTSTNSCAQTENVISWANY